MTAWVESWEQERRWTSRQNKRTSGEAMFADARETPEHKVNEH
jgi:hypothetical protein